eukprot:3926421-Pleurochrysis_carterae.AAC.2
MLYGPCASSMQVTASGNDLFLLAAFNTWISYIKFARCLNKVPNYKHQSWYVHYVVLIVAQQPFDYGNTWRFSTCAIESRGARLKRTGSEQHCDTAVGAEGSSTGAHSKLHEQCTPTLIARPSSQSGLKLAPPWSRC